jgi:hypothetical protein
MSGDLSPSLDGSGDEAIDAPVAAFEQKFLVAAEVGARVAAWARAEMRPDPHGDAIGEYGVTTVYLDTPDFAVFHRAPELHGAKYRIRRYGAETVAWLEKKVRSGDRVQKRRVRVGLPEIARLDAARWFDEEIRDLGLAPTCVVAYRRTAWFGSGDHGPFRLTLDRAIEGAEHRAWELGSNGAPSHALLQDRVVCELKFRNALPQLFKKLLADVGLEPSSFSKYRRMAIAAGLVEAKHADDA